MAVVIVESPAKAKTINKYLGKDFTVLASYGHVRDLPAKNGSVQPDDDFAMIWEVDSKSTKRLSDIVAALKGQDRLILATDPDREGEAISWHVLEILQKKGALKGKKIDRITFNAITKNSILEAMQNPRAIDSALVDAYLARRALDYLVGFTLSPVLWRKLPGARSAGRVQSVALRLVSERELEIERFVRREFWTIEAQFSTQDKISFGSTLNMIESEKLDKFALKDQAQAEVITKALKGASFQVSQLETKPAKRHPYPPFRTATLQQEASRKLGFLSSRTMQLAQYLYEGVNISDETTGLITYMRTDGAQIAGEAIAAVRKVIEKNFGKNYLPATPRHYTAKAKNAQEAHEAIRPTDLFRTPQSLRHILDADHYALYDLIWKRTVASQMESAELERTTVDISARGHDGKNYIFRSTGSVIKFEGFLKIYEESRDDDETEEGKRLPHLKENDSLDVERLENLQHFTEPPPRYSEASLTKKMEDLGIGRPSTYQVIVPTLVGRDYIAIEKKRLIPQDKGRLVTAFLEAFFKRYVEYDFTAKLEGELDQISNGEIPWKEVLAKFWHNFIAAIGEVKELRTSAVLEELNNLLGSHIFPASPGNEDGRKCPSCPEGRLSLKIGKFGAFIGCSHYPECRYTRKLHDSNDKGDLVPSEGIELGIDPETGEPVTRREGRFGAYLQLGEPEEGEKPKRASIPKNIDPNSLDLTAALKLLSLPREVGLHPESHLPILANFGRFGPFLLHDGKYANLPSADDVFTIGINHAVDLLAQKQERGPRQARASQALKNLGNHPDGGTIDIMSGRYGPYIKYNKINVTLPKDKDPQTLSLEEALVLIAEKAEKGPSKKPVKKAAKSPAKKAAKKTKKKGVD